MNLISNLRFRVVFESREYYRVIDENKNIFSAEISGKLRKFAEAWPAVGDWVQGQMQEGGWVLIAEVLDRKSVLQRQDVALSRPQILAANVDTLFIVTSANEDFNLNRLDRYVALALSGGVQPVVLINKIELAAEPLTFLEQVAARFTNIDVHAVSVYESLNLEALSQYAKPHQTIAFVGSSGVGKSSLTNYLMQNEVMQTSEIRDSDGRGRHTTTHRELQVNAQGCVLIDTPGLRSIALADSDGLDYLFSDIENLAASCRFTDCQHSTEPHCGILSALTEGRLNEERWQSYQKLQREVAFEERKQNKALQAEQKKMWAKRTSAYRQKLKDKGRK